MSLDLHPRNFPGYRPLLQQLAELWEPSSTTESTPTTTTPTTTPADLAAIAPAPAPAPAPSTTPSTTTTAPSDIAALRSEVAELRAHVAQLERVAASAPLPAPPPSPKPPKPPYIDVSQAVADSRWNCWAPTGTLDARYSGLPPSVAQAMFARHNGLSVREFARWFSPHRTHAPGSPQDTKYRERIHQALERLPKPCVTQ
jgi:hypothetical protein